MTRSRPALALYQPDIPQNAGALARLAACLGVELHIIEPCGFLLDDRRMRRAGLDYLDLASLVRHASWEAFQATGATTGRRTVLLTTRGSTPLPRFRFTPGDILLLGQESAGVPDAVHAAAEARIRIPLRPPARSLNVAMAGALALWEALRQLEMVPEAADGGDG